MTRPNLIFLPVLLLFIHPARGQNPYEKCLTVSGEKDILLSDSLTVIPGSVRIEPAADTRIFNETDAGQIRIRYEGNADSLRVCYKVMPYALNHKYKNRSIGDYDSSQNILYFRETNRFGIKDAKEELFHTESLNKTGAISRGISFGNSQDLYVNSMLNLQMDGKLSESLNIRASITDQNIPYQPEGNTVLVQDFDNVFIELYNEHFSVTGGDMMLRNHGSYFLQYQRNVQGAQFTTHYKTGKKSEASTSVGISAAKGRYTSCSVEPIDGVLGPYRLYGPGHEKFIIILANSEKVFVDGRLLLRGFNNDYVIDYNTAEVTFTSRVLITRYSRIIVDFQYNDQSYGRSVVTFNHHQNTGRLGLDINYFREKDNPGQPFALQLTNHQKFMLGNVTGMGNYGTIPGADSAIFEPGKILYKSVDTLISANERISVFVYTSSPDSARYQVSFTEVGQNKGNYIKRRLASGNPVYDWVIPVNGIPQGEYEPIQKVPLPARKQMFTIGTSYALGQYEKLSGEMAISAFDNNLYSNSSLNEQSGGAFKGAILSKDRPVAGNTDILYNGGLDIEYGGNGFRPVDRYKEVEYDRDWSFDPALDSSFTPDLSINLDNGIRSRQGFIRHQVSRRVKKDFIQGWQNKLDGALRISKLKLDANMYLMNNTMTDRHSNWLRYSLQSQYDLGYIVPGYRFSSDRNVIFEPGNDSISGSDMNYEEHLFFLRNNDSMRTKFGIQYLIRNDKVPQSGEFVRDNQSKTFGFTFDHGNGVKGKIAMGFFLRKLTNLRTEGKEDNSLNGKIDWIQPLFRDHIRSELTYSIGSGRELKREYIYYEVPGGQGTHTWRDDNGDGEKQLDEFYTAINADERNFIKLFIPSDEYVIAYNNILSYRLTADMPVEWQKLNGLRGMLARFSNTFSISANQKSSDFSLLPGVIGNPVDSFDPAILSQRGRIRNTFFYNRNNPGFGMDITYDIVSSKNLYSQGFEGRITRNLMFNSRVNLRKQYFIIVGYNHGLSTNGSDYLSGRNYRIDANHFNSSLVWQPSNFYRVTANLSHTLKMNAREEPVSGSSMINEAGLNFRISKASEKAIDCSMKFSRINFTGNKNTPEGYELLNGLQPGNNLSWSVNWQQKLFNGLQMNIMYEGRKSGDMTIIHMGRMQVTALF